MKNILFLVALLAICFAFPYQSAAQTPTEQQLQDIQKLMAPHRKKAIEILGADKTGQYNIYLADLEKIAAEKDPARKEDLLAKLERDHLPFIRSTYKRAVVNHEEMRREVARILRHNNFTFGEFADIQIEFTTPQLALPLRFDAEFLCPMEAIDDSDASQLASDCIAQAGTCSMSVQSLAEIAGGCRGKTSVGNRLELPEGTFTNITVTAQSDINYKGLVLAVAGYAQLNAKFGIRFRAGSMDKIVIGKEVLALAPILWFARVDGQIDNFVTQASFAGTFNGGSSVTTQVYTEGFAISVPIASFTNVNARVSNIDSIRLNGTD